MQENFELAVIEKLDFSSFWQDLGFGGFLL